MLHYFFRTASASRCRAVCHVFIGLVLLGMADTRRTSAQDPASAAGNAPFCLEYVPRDAVVILAARPAALLLRSALAAHREAIDAISREGLPWDVRPDEVTELTVVLLPSLRPDPAVAVFVRVASPRAAARLVAGLGGDAEARQFAGQAYFRDDLGTCFFQPNATSVMLAFEESTLRRCLVAGVTGATTTNWAAAWETVATQDVAALVNTSLLRAVDVSRATDLLEELSGGRTATSMLTIWQLAPLWQRSEYILAELSVTSEIALRLACQSATEDEARQVQSDLLSAVSMIRAALSLGRAAIASEENAPAMTLYQTIDLVDEILENARVVRDDLQVQVVAESDKDTTDVLGQVVPGTIMAARRARGRMQSLNNLRGIGLAMHNYHDVYRRFPAAVQLGPKNTPRSWRVTILPFVEQQALYDQYRQDEPWDSEHNRRILAAMPDVYRCPLDQGDSTNTSYFALVGPDTVFPGSNHVQFGQITDGTSNTLMVVESKQDTPWTKPDDIPFDAARPVPRFGGWYPDGFHGSLCDGSTLLFPHDKIDERTLRPMIMRADGEPVRIPY